MTRFVSLLALAGCAPSFPLVDDVEASLEADSAGLHDYVVGSTVGLAAVPVAHTGSLAGWTLESSDPDVAVATVIESAEGGVLAGLTAVSPGVTDLVLRDAQGDVRHEETIRVDTPVDFRLVPMVAAHRGEDVQLDGVVPVVEGGAFGVAVEWLGVDGPLAGAGALGGEEAVASLAGRRVDVLTLDTEGWIDVAADDLQVGEFWVETVPVDQVQDVVLDADDETGAAVDDVLVVAARAWDVGGREVYGAPLAWTAGGEAAGRGDVFVYRYDPEVEVALAADLHGLGDDVVVHGQGEATPSAGMGCQVVGIPPISGGFWAGLGLLVPAFVRRRLPEQVKRAPRGRARRDRNR